MLRREIRCDCGYTVTADDERDLVDGARAHARAAHGLDLSHEAVAAMSRVVLPAAAATDSRAPDPEAGP